MISESCYTSKPEVAADPEVTAEPEVVAEPEVAVYFSRFIDAIISSIVSCNYQFMYNSGNNLQPKFTGPNLIRSWD